jgi:hypothetical protein
VTLFPYTTLFRSLRLEASGVVGSVASDFLSTVSASDALRGIIKGFIGDGFVTEKGVIIIKLNPLFLKHTHY